MTQYLLSVYATDETFDHGASPEKMEIMFKQVDAFNRELQDTGKWVFAGGLTPSTSATTIRYDETNTSTSITDGPYVDTKEYIGGFWVVEADDMDEALKLAEQGAVACMGSVEVRPFDMSPNI